MLSISRTPLREYLDELPHGAIGVFAARVGISRIYLLQLAARQNGRLPSPELAASMERESAGRLTCERLSPDLMWRRVPDADWSWHPGGRPVIDVSRSADLQCEVRDAAA